MEAPLSLPLLEPLPDPPDPPPVATVNINPVASIRSTTTILRKCFRCCFDAIKDGMASSFWRGPVGAWAVCGRTLLPLVFYDLSRIRPMPTKSVVFICVMILVGYTAMEKNIAVRVRSN
jgi:hypothetical protein